MSARREFPDIERPAGIVEAVRAGRLVEISYGNDACPSYVRRCDVPIMDAIGMASGAVPVLWCEDADPARRESGAAGRYVVTGADGETVCEGDDCAEALADLFALPEPAALPKSREEALSMLRGMVGVGAVWHLDDDPRTVISDLSGRRTFTSEQAVWCVAFVATLNVLFADPADGSVCNAGAWRAADAVNWGGVSESA